MENVKFTVRMLAAYMRISIEELARQCEVEPSHLKQVSAGRVRMTAEDLQKLSAFTGIPAEKIEV